MYISRFLQIQAFYAWGHTPGDVFLDLLGPPKARLWLFLCATCDYFAWIRFQSRLQADKSSTGASESWLQFKPWSTRLWLQICRLDLDQVDGHIFVRTLKYRIELLTRINPTGDCETSWREWKTFISCGRCEIRIKVETLAPRSCQLPEIKSPPVIDEAIWFHSVSQTKLRF